MDYEKKYKEALERAKALNEGKTTGEFGETVCEYIFPELKESEDDKIRKVLIDYFDDINKADENPLQSHGIHTDKILAWLEKQGEQEQLYIRFGEIPTDEKSKIYQGEIEVGTENGISVYPAFKTDGENIVLGLTLPITKTTLYTQQHLIEYDDRPCYLVKGNYIGKDTDGQPLINNVSIIKRIDNYRVKEEKQDKSKFEQCIQEGDKIVTNEDGTHFNVSQLERVAKKEPKFKIGDEIKTINKEPMIITKIDEKGYWSEDLFICGFDEECICDLVKPKPLIEMITPEESLGIDSDTYNKIVDECVYGKQISAWSKEDEEMLNKATAVINRLRVEHRECGWPVNSLDKLLHWLKSFKERIKPQWNPSEEQMKQLKSAADIYPDSRLGYALRSLYQDLMTYQNN